MADRDSAPTKTRRPIDPAPPSDRPTAAMLKADIDSGQTGEKVNVFDPGQSPLGTDDEAAGRPPGPFRIALARRYENVERWIRGGHKAGYIHRPPDGALVGFVGFTGVAAALLVVGILLF